MGFWSTISNAFSTDGGATHFLERIPIVGYGVAGVQALTGNKEQAKRALALSTNSLITTAGAVGGFAIGGPAGAVAGGALAAQAGMASEWGIAKTINDPNVKGDVGEVSVKRALVDGLVGGASGLIGGGGGIGTAAKAAGEGLVEGAGKSLTKTITTVVMEGMAGKTTVKGAIDAVKGAAVQAAKDTAKSAAVQVAKNAGTIATATAVAIGKQGSDHFRQQPGGVDVQPTGDHEPLGEESTEEDEATGTGKATGKKGYNQPRPKNSGQPKVKDPSEKIVLKAVTREQQNMAVDRTELCNQFQDAYPLHWVKDAYIQVSYGWDIYVVEDLDWEYAKTFVNQRINNLINEKTDNMVTQTKAQIQNIYDRYARGEEITVAEEIKIRDKIIARGHETLKNDFEFEARHVIEPQLMYFRHLMNTTWKPVEAIVPL